MPRSGTARSSRVARWPCPEAALLLAGLACTREPASAVEPVPVRVLTPVVQVEREPPPAPPRPRLLGPPASWRVVGGSEGDPLWARVAMNDGLGCGLWLLDGTFVGATHDERCEYPAMGDVSWDQQKVDVRGFDRQYWSGRIDGKRCEGDGFATSTKRGRYRTLDFGYQATFTPDHEELEDGLALLVEFPSGELELELWNLGASKREASLPISRGDTPAPSEVLAGAWVGWGELELFVVLDLRVGDARRIRVERWPEGDPSRTSSVYEFPAVAGTANVTRVANDEDLVVIELERAGALEVWAFSIRHDELGPIEVPVH